MKGRDLNVRFFVQWTVYGHEVRAWRVKVPATSWHKKHVNGTWIETTVGIYTTKGQVKEAYHFALNIVAAWLGNDLSPMNFSLLQKKSDTLTNVCHVKPCKYIKSTTCITREGFPLVNSTVTNRTSGSLRYVTFPGNDSYESSRFAVVSVRTSVWAWKCEAVNRK